MKAFPALLTPVILLVGIYTGVMTPTEAGAVAALYALVIALFAYRILGFKAFLLTLKDTVIGAGQITILTGAAAVFTYIVAKENIPAMISQFILGITTNKYLLLIVINTLFLILGMFLDTAVLQFVFLPMVIPIVRLLGIDMVHFGVLICLNMMIGLSTPPFGFLLFITAGISNTPFVKITKEILPMIVVLLVLLMLVTFVPDIVLFIPNRMMG
jgi:tripartite ATP-independent transporter DctM subunit